MKKKVVAYIRENGIQPKTFAEKIGMSETAFRNFLAGRRRIHADEYIKLCRLMGKDLNTFYTSE